NISSCGSMLVFVTFGWSSCTRAPSKCVRLSGPSTKLSQGRYLWSIWSALSSSLHPRVLRKEACSYRSTIVGCHSSAREDDADALTLAWYGPLYRGASWHHQTASPRDTLTATARAGMGGRLVAAPCRARAAGRNCSAFLGCLRSHTGRRVLQSHPLTP